MGLFLLDVVAAAAVIAVVTLVVFVLLPSGKLDIAHVFFAGLIGIAWGLPLGVVYALGRMIWRAAFR